MLFLDTANFPTYWPYAVSIDGPFLDVPKISPRPAPAGLLLRLLSVVSRKFVRPATAQLVGLGVHHCVRDLLNEAPEQFLHVDGAVVKTGYGEHVRRQV